MNNFCRKCGAKLNGGEKFCGMCGAKCIEESVQPPAAAVTPPTSSAPPTPPTPSASHAMATPMPAIKRSRKPLILIGIAAVCVVAFLLFGKLYYFPYMMPESVLTSQWACDWVIEQIQQDTGLEEQFTVTAAVQTPAAAPKQDGLQLEYENVQCDYQFTVNGQTVTLSTKANFTTGIFPGNIKKIEFQEFEYPDDFLMEQQEESGVDSSESAQTTPADPEPFVPEQTEPADQTDFTAYTPLPEYHYGVWYSEEGYPYSLDEDCFLVTAEGDGITTDLKAKFVRRGSEEVHTLWIPVNMPDLIHIDGQVFTREEPQEDYILPESNQRYLTEADLESLTHEECCLARNEIYARHGRIFTTEEIASYFEEKDWYQGTIEPQVFDRNTSIYFNDYELKNVQLLQQYEKEKFGGSYY